MGVGQIWHDVAQVWPIWAGHRPRLDHDDICAISSGFGSMLAKLDPSLGTFGPNSCNVGAISVEVRPMMSKLGLGSCKPNLVAFRGSGANFGQELDTFGLESVTFVRVRPNHARFWPKLSRIWPLFGELDRTSSDSGQLSLGFDHIWPVCADIGPIRSSAARI